LLLDSLRKGEFKAHDRLPTEDELAARYGVSKITVRQALKALTDSGWLSRQQGRGTFVLPRVFEQGPRELTSFTEELRRKGMHARSVLLRSGLEEPETEVARKLEIRGGEVYRIERVRLADDVPMGVQRTFVPATLAPGLDGEDLENSSLYGILDTKYKLNPAYARETHWACPAREYEAGAIGIARGSAMLAAERIAYLPNDRPMELTFSYMRGDKYAIALELRRKLT
jgi:GntR family transcriptional regulator